MERVARVPLCAPGSGTRICHRYYAPYAFRASLSTYLTSQVAESLFKSLAVDAYTAHALSSYDLYCAGQVEALRLPATFQAVSLDTPFFSGAIHSPYKQPVGARLALGALSVAYGLSKYALPSYNPTGASATVHSSGQVAVKLVGLPAGGLLPVRRTIGFEILGASGFWMGAPILRTEGDTVILGSCPSGAKALRYLWYNCPCTTTPFRCPLYTAVPAIGKLSGELSSIPVGPFVLTTLNTSVTERTRAAP